MATKNRKTVRKNKRSGKSRKVRGGERRTLGKRKTMNLDYPPQRTFGEQGQNAMKTIKEATTRMTTGALNTIQNLTKYS